MKYTVTDRDGKHLIDTDSHEEARAVMRSQYGSVITYNDMTENRGNLVDRAPGNPRLSDLSENDDQEFKVPTSTPVDLVFAVRS